LRYPFYPSFDYRLGIWSVLNIIIHGPLYSGFSKSLSGGWDMFCTVLSLLASIIVWIFGQPWILSLVPFIPGFRNHCLVGGLGFSLSFPPIIRPFGHGNSLGSRFQFLLNLRTYCLVGGMWVTPVPSLLSSSISGTGTVLEVGSSSSRMRRNHCLVGGLGFSFSFPPIFEHLGHGDSLGSRFQFLPDAAKPLSGGWDVLGGLLLSLSSYYLISLIGICLGASFNPYLGSRVLAIFLLLGPLP
jgi:hypothetical protein